MEDAKTIPSKDMATIDPLTCVLLTIDHKKYPVTRELLAASEALDKSLVIEMKRRARIPKHGSTETGFGNEVQTPIRSEIMDVIVEWCEHYKDAPAAPKSFDKYSTLDDYQKSLFPRLDAGGMKMLAESAAYLKITLLTRFSVLAMCLPMHFPLYK